MPGVLPHVSALYMCSASDERVIQSVIPELILEAAEQLVNLLSMPGVLPHVSALYMCSASDERVIQSVIPELILEAAEQLVNLSSMCYSDPRGNLRGSWAAC